MSYAITTKLVTIGPNLEADLRAAVEAAIQERIDSEIPENLMKHHPELEKKPALFHTQIEAGIQAALIYIKAGALGPDHKMVRISIDGHLEADGLAFGAVHAWPY